MKSDKTITIFKQTVMISLFSHLKKGKKNEKLFEKFFKTFL